MDRIASMGEVLCLSYKLRFLFNNATGHLIYASNAFEVKYMNKKPRGQHPFFRAEWFIDSNQKMIVQKMSIEITHPLTSQLCIIQKGIQAVLVEQKLWPQGRIWLECEKPKCRNYQTFTTCRICIQGQKCDFCKKTRQYSGKCSK